MAAVFSVFWQALAILIAMGIVNFLLLYLLKKKFNPITSAIFTFVLNGLVVFIFVPYTYVAIYLPILLIYLLVDVLLANRKS